MTDDADTTTRGVGVVVVAAGSGSRLGAGVPKAFAHLAGRPLLGHALDTVARVPGLRSLVVVVPADLADVSGPAWAGVTLPPSGRVVAGGPERSESVAAGLAALDGGCDVVLVHDAARCLTPLEVFERVVDAVRAGTADTAGAVPGLPVVDTVKTVDAHGVITGSPARDALRAVQTPQGFRREVLEAAYRSGQVATDDAALVERIGHKVLVVEGDPRAFKVTTPADLEHAERLLATGP
ncbi:MAG TPA: 2-C-methyl-D-erythritol 4-phosphate cytidylyltransferase [Phycicoccus sp.]|nr:2-C-methyl-D-erythritol 4-phosphate cytidylyltransferase [Phycicoccus sp.]